MRCSIIIFWILLVVTAGSKLQAQTLINNNSLITITPGARVSVLGGALNNGDLDNNGVLSISGDWMNVDTYNAGTGLFILNGASPQNVAHNGQDIHQLEINGVGEKVFSSDVLIIDTLNLMEGIVTPQSGVIIQIMSGGAVMGGSDLSHINGALYQEGTGPKYFPVGKNSNYRPVEMINVSGTNPVIGFEMFEPNSNPQASINLIALSDTRYWQLIQLSGSYTGSPVKLKVMADENLGMVPDISDVAVTSSDQLSGVFTSMGQSLFTGSLQDGEVTSNMPALSAFYALGVEGLDEERSLYVPNALSPAAPDPEDRVIKVYGDQVVDQDFMFRIYNRWGKIIYETDSFTEANTVGWAGTNSQEDESVGVYQYTVTGRFISGNTFKRNGSITLIR
ncbi:MAG: gliding motility-associated C-terminal domain-containing protein [Cyclobacteriaceae bacterium]|nr:gliding motility-associated C-terminal domain-containing protein [Cyclobacteriaceae bacterium]